MTTSTDNIVVSRKIVKGSLTFRGLKWHSPLLFHIGQKLSPSRALVNLIIDVNDLGIAYAYDPKTPNLKILLKPVDPSYQEGLSLELHQRISEISKSFAAIVNDDAKTRERISRLRQELLDGLLKIEKREKSDLRKRNA